MPPRSPKALFRRTDRAALPWLQAATAGEAGRRAAERQGAAPVAPLALGGEAPRLRVPKQGAQEGAGPGSALSSSETNNSSRREWSPSKSPAARALLAPAPGRSRPASLPALLPHMKQLQSRGFWGVGAGVCARVCECVCLIASLLFFPSLPARLPASVPNPRSLHTDGEGERETHHTHSNTHAHAHAGYMNGRLEPILGGWASRGSQTKGAGPHHGTGGRHAGDARPPGATHPPLGRPSLSVLSDAFPSPLPSFLSASFSVFSPSSFLFVLEFSEFSQFTFSVSSFLTPSSLALSPPFSNFLLPCPNFSRLPLLLPFVLFPPALAFSPVSLQCFLVSFPSPHRLSLGLSGARGPAPSRLLVVISRPQHFCRDVSLALAASAQPEVIKS